MSRVMMIGYGPLPRPGLAYVPAATLRARQFLKPVLDHQHTVNLYTLPLAGTEGPEGRVAAMMPETYEGLAFQRLTSRDADFAIRTLTEQARQHKPDALVAVGRYPALIAARMATTLPLWVDLHGFGMAETQGVCWMRESDTPLEEAWTAERSILRRLDKFSAVSRAQLHAVVGTLAAVGRLNHHTVHYPFGHHIANAAWRLEEPVPAEGAEQPNVLRGPIVPPDAFIILWGGCYTIGCDIKTMVEAVNQLMTHYPSVHFVSTGGRFEGIEDRMFREFEELIERSPHKDRYHHLGWVELEKMVRIYHEADLGLNVDSMTYETLFGGRYRLGAMAVHGLAIASTIGTEISEWLDDARGLLAAPLGDPQALAAAIEPWIEQREELGVYARHARQLMEEDFSYERTARPLIEWLQAPALAPDNQAKVIRTEEKITDLSAMAITPIEEEAMVFEQHEVREVREGLEELRAMRARPRRRFIFGL